MTEAATIRQIRDQTRVIAVVGLSPKHERPSWGVARFLQVQGYRIVPLTDLASAPLANPVEAQMLARYADDFRNGSFTLYHGTETSGHVRQIGAR